MHTLKEIQRRMLKDVVDNNIADYLNDPHRLQVYSDGYYARLKSLMNRLYPMTRWIFGDQRFESLLRDYFKFYSFHEYDLDLLVETFPSFLEKKLDESQLWVLDVVHYEINPGKSEKRKSDKPQDVAQFHQVPLKDWEQAIFLFQPNMILQKTEIDVQSLERASEEKQIFSNGMVVQEPNYFVFCQFLNRQMVSPLEKEEFELLLSLSQKIPLGIALSSFSENIADSVFGWFRHWYERELITGIDIYEQRNK